MAMENNDLKRLIGTLGRIPYDWCYQVFNRLHEDAEDKEDWRLRFTWKMALK